MALLIQQYLRGGGTYETLLADFAIQHKRHESYPGLVLLKYNQLLSPFTDPMVRECRGIVLDELDGWRVICRAFDKFANLGEGYAADIDWSTARVQEKLDGSLATLYRRIWDTDDGGHRSRCEARCRAMLEVM